MSTEPSVSFGRQHWRNLLFFSQTSDEAALAWISGQTREGLEKLREGDGLTPLMAAAKEGKVAWVAALLPISDPLAQSHPEKLDALSMAAKNGHADVVRLLEPVSNLRAVEHWGDRTALMLAAVEGHAGCVEILAQKSDLSQRDCRGFTPLMLACMVARPECARWLCDEKTALDATPPRDEASPSGDTALTLLATNRMNSAADVLACANFVLPLSDLEARGAAGKTAFQLAVEEGRFALAAAIARKMDLARDDARWSAFGFLQERDAKSGAAAGREELMELLARALAADGQLQRLANAFGLHVQMGRWDCAEALSAWAHRDQIEWAAKTAQYETAHGRPVRAPKILSLAQRRELVDAMAASQPNQYPSENSAEAPGSVCAQQAKPDQNRKGSPRL